MLRTMWQGQAVEAQVDDMLKAGYRHLGLRERESNVNNVCVWRNCVHASMEGQGVVVGLCVVWNA